MQPLTLRFRYVGVFVSLVVLVTAGVARGATYSNTAPITINTSAAVQAVLPATPYPSTITVSGATGVVSDVNVSLESFWHRCVSDVDVLVVGPTGQAALIMSDAASGFVCRDLDEPFAVELRFDDAGGQTLPRNFTSGTFRPTDQSEDCPLAPTFDTFPAPAPSGQYGTALSAFNGTNPNGTWSLYVVDDCQSWSGGIDAGWALNITTAPVAARMAAFSATAAKGNVVVRWRTASESDVLGFNVFRGERRLNRSLVVARGGVSGAAYRFVDRAARRGVRYTYRLQVVNRDGSREWYGHVRLLAR